MKLQLEFFQLASLMYGDKVILIEGDKTIEITLLRDNNSMNLNDTIDDLSCYWEDLEESKV